MARASVARSRSDDGAGGRWLPDASSFRVRGRRSLLQRARTRGRSLRASRGDRARGAGRRHRLSVVHAVAVAVGRTRDLTVALPRRIAGREPLRTTDGSRTEEPLRREPLHASSPHGSRVVRRQPRRPGRVARTAVLAGLVESLLPSRPRERSALVEPPRHLRADGPSLTTVSTRARASSLARTPTSWLVAGVAWMTILVLLQHQGLLSHDTRFDVLLDPRDFIGRIWHLWDGRADMGRVQNQTVGYLFPLGPFYFVGDLLHVPAWISERLWMALLLGLAFWGSVRLADEFEIGTPVSRLLAGASYALSPFFIARVGNTSFFVQGAALLPWVVLPLVRGAREGSPRQAAFRSGLAVVVIGGINAIGTLAVLVVPALWLLTRKRGPRRRALIGWWVAAMTCATAWWGIPLVFQGRYGLDFLPLTERADLTTAPTAPFEVLRGTADWLSHLTIGVPQLPSGLILVASRPLIVVTALVATLAVYGLARRDMHERGFFIITLLVGMAFVGAAHGGAFGNPAANQLHDFLDGPGAAFRNVYKFQPIVMLPLSMGFAHGSTLFARGVQRAWRGREDLATAGAAIALGALVLASAQPLFADSLLNDRPFDDVPSWWNESATYLEHVSGRTLVVPGLPHADFKWGYSAEEPLFWLTNHPWASRTLIPLGSYGAIQYLDAVEHALERGGDPALIAYLQRGGFSTVLVRNDGKVDLYDAPRPGPMRDALVASGLTRDASY